MYKQRLRQRLLISFKFKPFHNPESLNPKLQSPKPFATQPAQSSW